MDDEQKPDPLLLGLAIRRKAKNEPTKMLTRTPSFRDWTNKGSILIKNEPWSSSSELASATKDWIPTKPPKNKFQSHYEEPTMVPFSPPNQVKLLPKPSGIPKRPRTGLKRKARGNEQFKPQQTPSPSPSPPPSTSNMMQKSADNLHCELCQISCSSALTLQQHLNGRPHKAKLLYRQLKRGCNGDRKGKPRCDVCQIWCSDRDGLNMHFKGQKHKAKLQESQLCKNNGGERISKTPIMCELCHVHCMNEDLFKMHIKGRQHATRVELKHRGML